MNEIKVSVVIPVYNIEKYLAKCLDSILNQTLKEIEIICVNDGSTDHSLQILKGYEQKYSSIIVIDKKNEGPGAARNAGIKLAKGEYIGFVDGDDFIDKRMYEALYAKAVQYEADVAVTNSYLYYPSSNSSIIFRDTMLFDRFAAAGCFTAEENPEILMIVGMWDRIFKRAFVERIGFHNPEGRFYEDHLPSFVSSVLADGIVVVNKAYYYYRQEREGSTINREAKYDSYKFDFLQDYREVHDFLKETGRYAVYQEQFLRYKIPFVLMHQQNMVQFSNFKKFFSEMAKEIEETDFQMLEKIRYLNSTFLKFYMGCLRKKRFLRCAFLFYLTRIIWRDALYVYFRVPKSSAKFRFRRRHYLQRMQFDIICREIAAIRNENRIYAQKLEEDIQQAVQQQNGE